MSSRNLFRFNVIDARGIASFVGPAHALKVIAAACSRGAENLQSVLDIASEYDQEWARQVRQGLHVFDEHNVDEPGVEFQHVGIEPGENPFQPFRVLNAEMRERSMVPARLGLVVFNLRERRIIQIQNSYANLMRNDCGRVRHNGKPTRQLFSYELSESWSIIP